MTLPTTAIVQLNWLLPCKRVICWAFTLHYELHKFPTSETVYVLFVLIGLTRLVLYRFLEPCQFRDFKHILNAERVYRTEHHKQSLLTLYKFILVSIVWYYL